MHARAHVKRPFFRDYLGERFKGKTNLDFTEAIAPLIAIYHISY